LLTQKWVLWLGDANTQLTTNSNSLWLRPHIVVIWYYTSIWS